jgi:hypothetical protein
LEIFLADDGLVYEERLEDERWLGMGYVPRPRSRLGWFVYHLVHGLAMRYPWWKVLGFALAECGGCDGAG